MQPLRSTLMPRLLVLAAILALLPLARSAQAGGTEWHVPSQFATIQEAIDFVSDGEVVVIAPGTYDETLDIFGKSNITIRGAAGAENTIVDGGGLGRQIARIEGGSTGIVIEGLTFQNCDPAGGTLFITPGWEIDYYVGGAMLVRDASQVTIQNCILRDNELDKLMYLDINYSSFSFYGVRGGALALVSGSSATIVDSRFENNKVHLSSGTIGNLGTNGGAIYFSGNGSLVIDGCEFRGNFAYERGAAISRNVPYISDPGPFGPSHGGTVAITDSLFEENSGANGGSGATMEISLPAGEMTMTGCQFVNNIAQNGISHVVIGGKATISDCLFKGNTALNSGSTLAVYTDWDGFDFQLDPPVVNITGCTFENNMSATAGVALYIGGSDTYGGGLALIEGCSFLGNNGYYGGIGVGNHVTAHFTACNFDSNSAVSGAVLVSAPGNFGVFNPNNISFTNCAFTNNSASQAGGVFWLSSTGGLSVENCTFENNSSAQGGSIIHATGTGLHHGPISFINSTLRNNIGGSGGSDFNPSSAGGAVSLKGWPHAEFIDCTIAENTSTNASFGAIHSFGTVPTLLLGHWCFCEGITGNPMPAIVPASHGLGQIDTSAWGGSILYQNGTSTNALPHVPWGDWKSMEVAGDAGIGTPIDIVVSMAEHKDMILTFATARHFNSNHRWFTGGTWSWATGDDPENFTVLPGVDTAPTSANYAVKTINLSSITALNDAETVILRHVFTGVGGTGDLEPICRFVNFQVRARPTDPTYGVPFFADSLLCENTPTHITGPWFDGGGNVLSEKCPDDPTCAPTDLDCDGSVGVSDLLILLANWGPCDDCAAGECPADLAGDCTVGVSDLLILLANWG